MNLKKTLVSFAVLGSIVGSTYGVSHAEYLTAYEDIHYEKYVVDTASFYYPNPKNKLNEFNCIVWRYTSESDKGSPFTYRFRFVNNTWKIAERKNPDADLEWVKVESNSIASDVLRVSLPYLGKTNTVDRNTTK